MKTLIPAILTLLAVISCQQEEDQFINKTAEHKTEKKHEEHRSIPLVVSKSEISNIELYNEGDHIETMDNTQKPFVNDDCMGVFTEDSISNLPYTYRYGIWDGQEIMLNNTPRQFHFVYPYDKNQADFHNIIIDARKDVDYLYASKKINSSSDINTLKFNHILSMIQLKFRLGNYHGKGKISDISINNIPVKGTFDLSTQQIQVSEHGMLESNQKFILKKGEAIQHDVNILIFPKNAEDIFSVSYKVDGGNHISEFGLGDTWKSGQGKTYIITVNEKYDCPVDIPYYPIEGEILNWWKNYQMPENTLAVKETNEEGDYITENWNGKPDHTLYETAAISPGLTPNGMTLFRGIGNSLVPWIYVSCEEFNSRYEKAAEDKKYNIEVRYYLSDPTTGNIVCYFPKFTLKTDNNNNNFSARRRIYIPKDLPLGTYKLGFLMKRSDADYWIKAALYDGVKDSDMYYKVVDPKGLPLVKSIETSQRDMVSNYKNPSYLIFREGANFKLYFQLTNHEAKKTQGKVVAIWERTFKVMGNSRVPYMYQKLDKRNIVRNDDEWEDILGTAEVNMEPDDKGWNGIINCHFPVERKEPAVWKASINKWIGYCSPKVHLYWQEKGSDKLELLPGDYSEEMSVLTAYDNESPVRRLHNMIGILPDTW